MIVAATCLSLFFLGATGQAGKPVLVGKSVVPAKRVALDKVDHSTWDSLLRKFVDERGMVNYKKWKASSKDLKSLEDYINQLSAADPKAKTSKPAALAYWINAYNAVTVYGILKEYPTSSIRNHTAKLWGYNIWKDLKLRVGGQEVSLDAMEHQVLRKMDEPRIHFAIVCASVGCPRLLNKAYVEGKIEEQLTENSTEFFKRSDRFQYTSDTLKLSPILDWFGEDFGESQQKMLVAIARYLPEGAQGLAKSGKAKVQFLAYDWSLNEQGK